jgi:glycolate oxidase FAD binding subunit
MDPAVSEEALLGRLRRDFGDAAVEAGPGRLPRICPDSTQAVADLCGFAHREGLRVRIEGQASWMPPDAPADLALATRRLQRITELAARDLVATVESGIPVTALNGELATQGAWLAIDPPGDRARSLGSVIATGTAGPLRHGYGPIRDHLLGLTVVTGDGRVVRAGGKVVKNVAGYDLTRLQVGGFGAFGIVTEAHLRLRAVPTGHAILVARGKRDALTYQARTLTEESFECAVMELTSPLAPSEGWTLRLDLVGAPEAIQGETARLLSQPEPGWTELSGDQAAAQSEAHGELAMRAPVSIRLGVFADSLDEILDLLEQRLGRGIVSAGAGRGTLRWSGAANPTDLQELRRILAAREIPLTLERGPWELRRSVGHFGDYREGVSGLVPRLRAVFDPDVQLVVALEAEPS